MVLECRCRIGTVQEQAADRQKLLGSVDIFAPWHHGERTHQLCILAGIEGVQLFANLFCVLISEGGLRRNVAPCPEDLTDHGFQRWLFFHCAAKAPAIAED